MKRHIIHVLTAVFACTSLFADTYDERLKFVATTGSQYIDTGLLLNFKRSKFKINFRIVERPETTVALCGAVDSTSDITGYTNVSGKVHRRSWAMRVGKTGSAYVVFASFAGSEQSGYYHPASGNYAKGQMLEVEGRLTTALFNQKEVGYEPYAESRYDETLAEGNSFLIGNVNKAGTGLWTPSGSMPKIHWYGAKFWTDDELVGDFVPAKKNGIAGFFDLVTERFFPSEGEDPFVAPNHIEWTGGGDTSDFADGENWSGGVAPANSWDVALFPPGTHAGATFGDIEDFFNPIGGIELAGPDSILSFTNATATTRMYTPTFGAGTLRFNSGALGSHLYLCQDNRYFDGLLELTNAAKVVYVSDGAYNFPWALGVEGKSRVSYFGDGNERVLQFGNGTFTCDLTAVKAASRILLSSTTYAGSLTFPDTSYAHNINGNGATAYLACSISNECQNQSMLYMQSGVYTFTNAAKAKHFGKMQIQTNNMRFYSPVSFDRHPADESIQKQANILMNNSQSSGLVFCTNDVFSSDMFLLYGYTSDVTEQKLGIFNMNGFSQRLGTLGLYANSDFNPMSVWNTNLCIKSETPATLTVYGTFRCDRAKVNGSVVQGVFPGCVSGAASVTLDSRSECFNDKKVSWPGVARFNNPLSDTTGSLAVNCGTLHVMPTAAFSNLSSVVVSGSGLMKVETADVGNANEDFFVCVSNAESSARLEIVDGVTLKARTSCMNGVWLDAGLYSSAASEGVKACKWLAGDGILDVAEYGGPKGMILIFR